MKFAVSEDRMIKYQMPGTAFLHLHLMFSCFNEKISSLRKKKAREGELELSC